MFAEVMQRRASELATRPLVLALCLDQQLAAARLLLHAEDGRVVKLASETASALRGAAALLSFATDADMQLAKTLRPDLFPEDDLANNQVMPYAQQLEQEFASLRF